MASSALANQLEPTSGVKEFKRKSEEEMKGSHVSLKTGARSTFS